MWPVRFAMYWGARPSDLPRSFWRLHGPKAHSRIASRRHGSYSTVVGARPSGSPTSRVPTRWAMDEVEAEIRSIAKAAGARAPETFSAV